MEPHPFLDTNILVRLIAEDHVEQVRQARELLVAVERGDTPVITSDTVIFEAVYTLQSVYKFDRNLIAAALQTIISLGHLHIEGKARYRDVFALYVSRRGPSFADCYHAVLARELSSGKIFSFDRGFDRIPGVNRIEPALPA
jgi:predicted nucleic acid-binding protein